ncbi:hypothetical protein CLV36_110136 [Laceyella sediminis]|jgi:hypothetical protein|uniref:Uncharacterized protein n=2 Tax=Laceyella TaxID=292635 RepID=A0AA45WR81_9BACL|nr:hypothetical protein CLV36_110136 [Laceyella sediminis]SMP28436.1 hypothetical protein SAMN06265361_10689 [Laceyella tengchongensis]
MCLEKKRTFLVKGIEIHREMWHNVVVISSYCSAVECGRRDHAIGMAPKEQASHR